MSPKNQIRIVKPDSAENFDATETVLLEIPNQIKKKPIKEKNFEFTTIISLYNEEYAFNSNILFEIPILCLSDNEPNMYKECSFNYKEIAKDIKNKKGEKEAKFFTKICESHPEIVQAEKCKIIGGWDDSMKGGKVIIVRPIPIPPPPINIFFYETKKPKKKK